MRRSLVLSCLMVTQLGWALSAGAQSELVPSDGPLILIPTAVQELAELRVITDGKATSRDGTVSTVYVKTSPAKGNTYLNFHIDVSSETGPFTLSSAEIHLDGAGSRSMVGRAQAADGKAFPWTQATASYVPLDWFIESGIQEVRGQSLTVKTKAILQFTIEVPREGRDDLTLFVRSQRIGTVREIRARIAEFGGDL